MIRRGSRVFLVSVQRGVEGEAAWQMVRESLDCLSEGRLTKNIISVNFFSRKVMHHWLTGSIAAMSGY